MTHQDLLNTVEEFGSPLYVYDAEKIKAQYQRLPVGGQDCFG